MPKVAKAPSAEKKAVGPKRAKTQKRFLSKESSAKRGMRYYGKTTRRAIAKNVEDFFDIADAKVKGAATNTTGEPKQTVISVSPKGKSGRSFLAHKILLLSETMSESFDATAITSADDKMLYEEFKKLDRKEKSVLLNQLHAELYPI